MFRGSVLIFVTSARNWVSCHARVHACILFAEWVSDRGPVCGGAWDPLRLYALL